MTPPDSVPRVGAIVLNYEGGEMTLDCIEALHRTAWPSHRMTIVLVDNASTDGVVAEATNRWPDVHIIVNDTNRGFAAGMNAGIRWCLEQPDIEYVALLNNDVTVSQGWLRPLVAVLVEHPDIGAACPRIRFATTFVDVSIQSDTTARGVLDRRRVGVRLSGARVDGHDVWRRAQLVAGFWGPEVGQGDEPEFQWTRGAAAVRLPVRDDREHALGLRLAANRSTAVEVRSGDAIERETVGAVPTWVTLHARNRPYEVINNCGSDITDDGYGFDRGYMAPDDGSWDAPSDVVAWCGAAVLLRREYLEDVGLLDERLFMYYEDLELSRRGSTRGWRYRYVPASIVAHVHSATTVATSRFSRFYNERNRLLVLARYESWTTVLRQIGRFILITLSYARRDLLTPLFQGQRPSTVIVVDRLRALGGFLGLLPAMRRSRRQDRALAIARPPA